MVLAQDWVLGQKDYEFETTRKLPQQQCAPPFGWGRGNIFKIGWSRTRLVLNHRFSQILSARIKGKCSHTVSCSASFKIYFYLIFFFFLRQKPMLPWRPGTKRSCHLCLLKAWIKVCATIAQLPLTFFNKAGLNKIYPKIIMYIHKVFKKHRMKTSLPLMST